MHKREEDYIYNRTVIGGIDETKFDFAQAIRKKIYLSKPSKASWIIFVILSALILGGTVFYKYIKNTNIPYMNNVFSMFVKQPEVQRKEPEDNSFIKNKLLEIKFVENVNDDEFLKFLENNPSTENNQMVKLILDSNNTSALAQELEALHKLVNENIQE